MKRSRVLLLILIAALLLCGYRVYKMVLGNLKTGEVQTSPDGRFEASVMDSYSETFWGQQKHWLEFSLRGEGIDKVLKTDYIEGPYFGSRSSYSVIKWSDDSSSVHFTFLGTELVFETSLSE